MAKEMYVESSNAVPASAKPGGFDKAAQTGNTLGMISALRASN